MQRSLLIFLALSLSSCAYYFGNGWQRSFKKIPKTEYPRFSDRPARITDELLQTHPLVLEMAETELVQPSQKAKTTSPRILLAKLVAHKDVKAVNEFLLNSTPWGNSGTSGFLNPKGDYDFTTILLSAILFRFENDTALLWPQTADHIAQNLLIEEGGKPHTKTPRTLRIMKDTENHILMTNISQYLKNQWFQEHGNTDERFNNRVNGMEQFLLDNLEELQQTGQYEFNSKPYEGYTISALLVLHAYAHSAEMKEKVAQTLDNMVWEYLQTSDGFRKNSPFRRRMERANGTSLADNASTSMFQTWYLEQEQGVFDPKVIAENHHQAFSALVFDYRPPTEIWRSDDTERMVLIGHGKGSSPEIYSRGKGWMLSAGGFQRGETSQIVARPIVLMLNDEAAELSECFHIDGKGKWTKWNNTGVHHRFAVGRSAGHVPSTFQVVDTLGNWKLYEAGSDLRIVTYSSNNFGLIFLPESPISLAEIAKLNPDPTKGIFNSSVESQVHFELNSPKGKWVITVVNGEKTNRKTDTWPRVVVNRLSN
ncbi:MAG: hypothetical protein K9J17_16255 [Flavobacteriales bacterium]|nr:hypothetical protein [Flavobacteriales bacterium]